jgi:prepilin-type N-terminal cleavage/methylation domain-containing protein
MVRKMKNKQVQNECGFTLLEILLSITILGIILLGFFQFFGQSMIFSNKNEAKLQAVNIARQVMNELQGQALNKSTPSPLSSTNPNHKEIINSLLQSSNVDDLTNGRFEITLSFDTYDDPLVQVTVKVTSLQQNISAETYGYMKLSETSE